MRVRDVGKSEELTDYRQIIAYESASDQTPVKPIIRRNKNGKVSV